MTRSTLPNDRLTRVCDAMLDAFKQHPETVEADRAIVFLVNGDDKRGGIALRGYDDDKNAVVDLLIHLKAILREHGQDLHVISVGPTPEEDRQ